MPPLAWSSFIKPLILCCSAPRLPSRFSFHQHANPCRSVPLIRSGTKVELTRYAMIFTAQSPALGHISSLLYIYALSISTAASWEHNFHLWSVCKVRGTDLLPALNKKSENTLIEHLSYEVIYSQLMLCSPVKRRDLWGEIQQLCATT